MFSLRIKKYSKKLQNILKGKRTDLILKMLKEDTAASGEIIFLFQSKLLAVIILENAHISDLYLPLASQQIHDLSRKTFPSFIHKDGGNYHFLSLCKSECVANQAGGNQRRYKAVCTTLTIILVNSKLYQSTTFKQQ